MIGTIGTPGKERRALEFGAAKVINRGEEDFVSAVMDFTSGKGVDKIIDSTGGSILDRSFETIRIFGHIVSYGEAEAKPYANLWERLVRKSLTFTRFHLGHVDYESDAWKTGAAKRPGARRERLAQGPYRGGLSARPAYMTCMRDSNRARSRGSCC